MNKTMIHVGMSEKLRNRIKEESDRLGLTMSGFVRSNMVKVLEKREEVRETR